MSKIAEKVVSLVIFKAIFDLLLGVIDLQRSQLHLVYYDFYARIPANILKYFFSKPVNNKIIVLFLLFVFIFDLFLVECENDS